MGLDISINTDVDNKIYSGGYDYYNTNDDNFHKHSLSRTFCYFMSRKEAISGEPELDQIGNITSIDISSIYKMEPYDSESGEENKNELSGNIDEVLVTIESLIHKLSFIDNLPLLLNDNGYDSLNNKVYFADFNIDKGDGYMGNNFGQDLRNFKRFVVYAKDKGATTIYFNYG